LAAMCENGKKMQELPSDVVVTDSDVQIRTINYGNDTQFFFYQFFWYMKK
jgi:hypothetical protein